MQPDELKQAASELRRAMLRLNSLANLSKYGVLVDTRSTALRIAEEIHSTARSLEGASNQLELLPPEAKP